MLMIQNLSRWIALAAMAQAASGLSDAPTREQFVRRGTARATVLGNYVYVDGGEISQLGDDGKIAGRTSNQVNSTLSIDISKSWSAETVSIRTIPKTGPLKTNTHIFTDAEGDAFYSWGGKWIGGVNMTKTELWQFKADGSGGGSWSVVTPANPSLASDLLPGEFGAYTTVKDTGFVIGGVASGWTQLQRARTQTIPGMLTFNMKSKIWENGTLSAGFSPFETLSAASAEYVPVFGPNGLVVILGGWSPSVVGEPDIQSSPVYDLKNITFMDPQTKKRYWQEATGDIPPSPRMRFCSVGFQTTNRGYDIFIFGGINQRAQITYRDAYVLSLPGFVWTKMPDSPAGNRAEHTCVAVGKRQVLSIGGTNVYTQQWTEPDPAPQGLHLFDVTAMKWSNSYSADAAAYESPEAVKNWYSSGSLNSVSWSSDDVKRIFLAATNGSSSGIGPSSSGNTTAGGSTPVGAIAGGAVGGVAVLALVGFTVWWCLRRKKQQQQSTVDPVEASELAAGTDRPVEKYTYAAAPHEVGSPLHQELYGHHHNNTGHVGDYQELYGNGNKVVAPNDYYELYGHASPAQTPVELDSAVVPRR